MAWIFKSQKTYSTARCLSRLRRLSRKRRIANGFRPNDCIKALNDKLTDGRRFHATKGWR